MHRAQRRSLRAIGCARTAALPPPPVDYTKIVILPGQRTVPETSGSFESTPAILTSTLCTQYGFLTLRSLAMP